MQSERRSPPCLSSAAPDADRLRRLLARYDLDTAWPLLCAHLHVSESQQKQYLSGIRHLFAVAEAQGENLLDPSVSFAARFHDSLAHLQPGSRRVRIAHARAFYRALRLAGVISPHLDPFLLLRGATETPTALPELYSEEEIERLLEHGDLLTRLLVLLGAHAGLATREITTLRWEDLTLAADTLHVRGREIAVPREVHDALHVWARRDGGALYATGLVFPDQAQPRQLLSTLYRACQRADVPYRAWRALRNHYALRLFQTTHDAEVVRQQLGVASLKAIEPYRRLAHQTKDGRAVRRV